MGLCRILKKIKFSCENGGLGAFLALF